MTSSLRLLAKSSFLLCVLVLLIVGFFFAWFASWRADRLASLDSASEIAKTDRGPVEFLVRGEGPAVLVFHGAPGGYDQAMLIGFTFVQDEFQIVAPSRPGYLRTPLTTGLSPEQQADAMASLIDTDGNFQRGGSGKFIGERPRPSNLPFDIRVRSGLWCWFLRVTAKFDPCGARSGSNREGSCSTD